MKKVSVIIPCYNEAQSAPLLYAELCKLADSEPNYEWEFLFINDGSRDTTVEVLSKLRKQDTRCNYVDLSRNYGKEVALLAGFDYATGDCAVIMDADLQHPPHVVHDMLRKWEEGYDDIYARRVTRGKESWLRKRLSLAYYKLLSKSTRIDVLPNVGDFRLLDRCCLDALRQMREQSRYTKGMYCYVGFKKTYVDFETQERVAGQSSMSYRVLIRLAIEGLTAYTTSPLQWATGIGLVVSLISFLYAIWVVIKTIVWGDPVAGFPTLLIAILFLGGVQLLSLGIIGEYLGRVFNETKNRPVYFVRTYNDEKI
ncbi:MAG: glycosyltransferase family 2 protein [Paludibacteraceae bacterium]|nr:glycosyltransferase family 2 protein [Paludibacteraceae bacterium]